ncbi:hypothetical protein [Methanobrevibacter sp.]|uniref:hypothetical protein n=1 Tax=Methanobrevibacter sp. TaxID=66852 RepID=UPI00386F5346
MRYKKIIILSIILTSLLVVSAVSAADNATDDVCDVDEYEFDNNQTLKVNEIEEDVLSASSPEDSFNALNNLINGNNNKEIKLTKDYNFYNDKWDKQFATGIPISRSVVIDGDWHILDANYAARMFEIKHNNITLKNIIFIHGKSTDGSIGGAITFRDSYYENWFNVTNCMFISNQNTALAGGYAINSTFIRNTGGLGGATYMTTYIENCTFKYNYASTHGGAINWGRIVKNSVFIGNTIGYGEGGAVWGTSDVENCMFMDNYGGGALSCGNARNCVFINNRGWSDGGAISGNEKYSAVNCTFIGNSALNGGAISYINAINCTFKDNTATEYGGAIYKANATNCFFINNKAAIEGNDEYNSTLIKTSTKLIVPAVNTIYNDERHLIITLKDQYDNPLIGYEVSVNFNGKASNFSTGSNGQVKISTKTLAPGTYDARISFNGNINYDKSTLNSKVVVKKATPKLTANKKTFKVKVKTKKYSVTLKTNQNKALAKAQVTIKVNGKTYKATTNAKGKATFKITKLTKKGSFKATVAYKGNKYYTSLTKNVKITIK